VTYFITMVLRKRSMTRVYEIGDRLACGGMSELYEATMDGKYKVAVKRLILPDQEGDMVAQGFFREAAVLGSMDHPNVVELIDAGESDGEFFLIMELIEGISVADLLEYLRAQGETIDPDLAFGIIGQVARGLVHAHERAMPDGSPLGVVHRDVAPENILVTTEGVPKLIDFGIATLNGFEITAPGVIRGHSNYMSPEQARTEKIDARSDVFALGAVLFELLSQEALYTETQQAALLWKVQQGDYPCLSDRLSKEEPELIEILSKALAVKSEERYRSARNFERHLDRFRAARGLRVDRRTIARMVAVIAEHKKKQRSRISKGDLRNSSLVLEADDPRRPGSFSSPHMRAIEVEDLPPSRPVIQKRKRVESPELDRPPSLSRPPNPTRLNSVLRARAAIKQGWKLGVLVLFCFALAAIFLASRLD
jgi:eukaryotic-like serine/threonine-protein kinase